MLNVCPKTLIAIAGWFWLIAGANVVAVGIGAYLAAATDVPTFALLAAGTAATFAVFFFRIFRPYSDKHARRIEGMGTDKVPATRFMDAKGYLMIAFMVALGAAMRLGGLVPDWVIAFFYVGLGAALALTGIRFLAIWRNGSNGPRSRERSC